MIAYGTGNARLPANPYPTAQQDHRLCHRRAVFRIDHRRGCVCRGRTDVRPMRELFLAQRCVYVASCRMGLCDPDALLAASTRLRPRRRVAVNVARRSDTPSLRSPRIFESVPYRNELSVCPCSTPAQFPNHECKLVQRTRRAMITPEAVAVEPENTQSALRYIEVLDATDSRVTTVGTAIDGTPPPTIPDPA
jgi:hypothetical protein